MPIIRSITREYVGKPIRCKAAICRKSGEPLVIEEIELEPPKSWEVRIKILYTSLCHSDVTFWKMDPSSPAAMFPRILGHEGVGVVESVGEHVEEVKEGDLVVPVFQPNCGECIDCESPKSNICSKFGNGRIVNMPRDGTSRFRDMNGEVVHNLFGISSFSEYTVVDITNVVKISHDFPLDKACLLSCGVSTGVGAVWKVADVEKGSTVAVFGLGAVGLARPENKLGDDETWDRAESALKEALDEFGKPWQLNEGDGAFYGPKIDISVSDALSRKFQCATLQLDFQLPDRFKLEFSAEDEAKIERPVMIHRAILGSVERMFAILLEHYKGKWPFWLSPRQAILCPVSEKSQAYALKVRDQIHQAGYHVDADTTDRKIQKKIREAQLAQYNYILVVGEEEANTGQVSVRVRDKADHSVMTIENLLKHFNDEVAAFH